MIVTKMSRSNAPKIQSFIRQTRGKADTWRKRIPQNLLTSYFDSITKRVKMEAIAISLLQYTNIGGNSINISSGSASTKVRFRLDGDWRHSLWIVVDVISEDGVTVVIPLRHPFTLEAAPTHLKLSSEKGATTLFIRPNEVAHIGTLEACIRKCVTCFQILILQ